jgi:hypothetical protein
MAHLPIGAPSGPTPAGTVLLYTDGVRLQLRDSAGDDVLVHLKNLVFTVEGNLSVSTNPLRIRNRTGLDRNLVEVHCEVTTAPTGGSIDLDILMDGVTVFANPGAKPKINSGAFTDTATNFDTGVWVANSYLQLDVTGIGGATPGADLVVQVIYN